MVLPLLLILLTTGSWAASSDSPVAWEIAQSDANKTPEIVRTLNLDEKALFPPMENVLPEGWLYHGTNSQQSFRSILTEGPRPSKSGAIGAGFYGVALDNKQFAESWINQFVDAAPDLLLRFPIKKDARIADLTGAEGKKLIEHFTTRGEVDFEGLAKALKADVLKYDHVGNGKYRHHGFLVKNSAVLGTGEGVYKNIVPLSHILPTITEKTSFREFLTTLKKNGFSESDTKLLRKRFVLTPEKLLEFFENAPMGEDLPNPFHWSNFQFYERYLGRGDSGSISKLTAALMQKPWRNHPEILAAAIPGIASNQQADGMISTLKYILNERTMVQKSDALGSAIWRQVPLEKKSLLLELFPDQFWQRHPEAIPNLLEEAKRMQNQSIAELIYSKLGRDVLGRAIFASQPETIKSFLMNGSESAVRNFITEVLSRPEWKNQPTLPLDIAQRNISSLNKALDRILASPHWINNPELLKLTGGATPSSSLLRFGLRARDRGIAPSASGLKRGCQRIYMFLNL